MNNYNLLRKSIIIIFIIIFISFFKLCIIDNSKYLKLLEKKTKTYVYKTNYPRGRIYDRNMNLIVDNKSIPSLIYNSNNNSIHDEIVLSYKISKNLEIDYSKLNKYDIKEFYLINYPEEAKNLITDEEYELLKNRKITNEDLHNMKINRIKESDINIFNETDLKACYIYYLMNKGYSYEDKIIKSNITDLELSYFSEHLNELNGFNISYSYERVYLYDNVFRSLLGSISSIPSEYKDYYIDNGYSLNDLVGISYLEKEYDNYLKSTKDIYELKDNKLTLISEGKPGNDIVLSIDIKLQEEVEKILDKEVLNAKYQGSTEYYSGSYVVIQEPNTGEILAISGKKVILDNNKYKVIDSTTDILFNPITAGSVVKGASMLVGYSTNAIKIGEVMNDSCIKIYLKPEKCSWKSLGTINDIDALAYSSNIFQFKTAMKVDGFKYSYNKDFIAKKSTFDTYRSLFNKFGLGVKTGIDLPSEGVGTIGNNYSSDLLLNYTIGQYDTYTVMQLSQYINTIASNGNRYSPRLVKYILIDDNILSTNQLLNNIDVPIKYISRVQLGFRSAVKYGLASTIMGNSPSAAGKTGTSESFIDSNNDGVIDTETLSNTFVGYAPYKNPIMSIVVASPNLVNPNSKDSSISYANHRITRLISNKFFKIYNNS